MQDSAAPLCGVKDAVATATAPVAAPTATPAVDAVFGVTVGECMRSSAPLPPLPCAAVSIEPARGPPPCHC